MISGTKSAKDAFTSMAQSIVKDLAQIAAKMALSGLFDLSGGPKLFGSLFSGAASAGGSTFFPSASFLDHGFGGFATGGPVNACNPIMVGEAGREMFIPSVPGRIIPNNELGKVGGGGNSLAVNINAPVTVNATGGTQAQNADLAKQVSDSVTRQIRGVVSDELIRQQRVGGILRPGLGARVSR